MIPVYVPFCTKEDIEAVANCVNQNDIAHGPQIEQFEHAWANICRRKYGIAVCNGSAALELACEALDIGPDKEVIVPSFTIISCALAIIRCGATPVVVDVDPLTWCLNPDLVERHITPKTAAVMVVHTYGQPADMTAIGEICAKHSLPIIEDAAQAHGSTYQGQPCGSFGEVSCFSFYANKAVSCGEGGMVVTNDDRTAERIRSRRNLCFGRGWNRFIHHDLGHNYRLSNLQASLGLSQSKRLPGIVTRKRGIFQEYADRLVRPDDKGRNKLALQMQQREPGGVPWMVGVATEFIRDAGGLRRHPAVTAEALAREGIGARPFFTGLHAQPCLVGKMRATDCPVASWLAQSGLYLPSSLALTSEEIGKVCDIVEKFNVRT